MRALLILSTMVVASAACGGGRPPNFPNDVERANRDAVALALAARGLRPVEPIVADLNLERAIEPSSPPQRYRDEQGEHAILSLGKSSSGPKLRGSDSQGTAFELDGFAARGADGRTYSIVLRAKRVTAYTADVDDCPPGGGAPPPEPLYYVPLEGGPATYGGDVEISLEHVWVQRFNYLGRGPECMRP